MLQRRYWRLVLTVLLACVGAVLVAAIRNADSQVSNETARLAGEPCRIPGYAHELACGVLEVPLQYGVGVTATRTLRWYKVPARARYPQADPVIWIADGPGVYPTDRAPAIIATLRRVMNDRDLIWLEPRGLPPTPEAGCVAPGFATMADRVEPLARHAGDCRAAWAVWQGAVNLTASAHADDLERLRSGMGLAQVNLLAEGYGARVADAWAVRYPARIRTMVLDSPAPLVGHQLSLRAVRTASALRKVFAACGVHPACAVRFPDPAADLALVRKSLPDRLVLPHPQTGQAEALEMDDRRLAIMLERIVKTPARAAALPAALHAAAKGEWSALVGLSALGWSAQDGAFAWELWLADACQAGTQQEPLPQEALAAWFFTAAQQTLAQSCGEQHATSPMRLETSRLEVATLGLVGRFDPLSGDALRDGALRIEVDTGHGVLGLGCAQDVVFRFIRAGRGVTLENVDAACLERVPYPTPFVPAEIVLENGKPPA